MLSTLLLSLSLLIAPASTPSAPDFGPPPQDSSDETEVVAARGKKAAEADAEGGAEAKMGGKKGPQSGMNGAAADVQSFQAAVKAAEKDPHQTADLFIKALAAYTLERDLGLQMLAMLLPESDLMLVDGVQMPNRFRQDELLQLDKKPDVMKGYCGGTPDKKYENADVPNCKATFDTEYSKTRQGVCYPQEDRAKFFITNGGSSRPRPMELERDSDGKWLINKYGLLTGVAAPAE